MKVFIASFDLFSSVGGGQTFYRSSILRNPHIEFYYLRLAENPETSVPPNAHPVPYREVYSRADIKVHKAIGPLDWRACLQVNNVSAAVAGRSFDLIDVPDYDLSCLLMQPALRRHQVDAARIALSMHGRITTSKVMNWGSDGLKNLPLVECEELLYSSVDLRYFISAKYRDEWRLTSPLDTHLVDPMWFFTPPTRREYRPSEGPPELNFIGRTEKLKGPHLFLDLLGWLPIHSYSSAAVIGPESIGADGRGSHDELGGLARTRGIDVRFRGSLDADGLARAFAEKSVTVIPSQYDTLNLVALESLCSGCPTVIGSGAGVCRYLRERFPGLPFVEFNVADFYGSVPKVEELLAGYDAARDHLSGVLSETDFSPIGPSLESVYNSRSDFNSAARAWVDECYERMTANLRGVTRSVRRPSGWGNRSAA